VSAAFIPVILVALLCIDGWLTRALKAYDRRTEALTTNRVGPV
jgi:hypothetical protein